jgi:hypothetical protein
MTDHFFGGEGWREGGGSSIIDIGKNVARLLLSTPHIINSLPSLRGGTTKQSFDIQTNNIYFCSICTTNFDVAQ